jgi:alkylhydroperoxidase family enzyme
MAFAFRRESTMKTIRAVLLGALVLQGVARAAGPRIAPVPAERETAEQESLAANFASSGMPNAVATYLNHPALAEHVLPYEHYVWTASTLPPRHRALVGLRTIWLTRSEYLWAHRAGAGRQAGLSDAELRRIAEGPDASGWDSFEAVLLRAADELHVDSFVSDATWHGLSARYNTNQLTDLVDSAGAVTMHAGAINSLGVEIEPGIIDRFPPRTPPTSRQPDGRTSG